MLADVILEWSGGGIFCPSFSRSGGMEWSGTDFLEWSEKRSSLRKKWSVPKSDIALVLPNNEVLSLQSLSQELFLGSENLMKR